MFIVFMIGLVNFIATTLTYLYYRHCFEHAKGCLFTIIYFLLSTMTVVSRLLPEEAPFLLVRATSWIGGLWMAFVYYSLLLAILHLLLHCAGKLAGRGIAKERVAAIGFFCIALSICWGTHRAFSPIVRTEKVSTSKLPSGHDYRIVLVSDVHLGRILGYSYARKLKERINSLHPDVVLIAGDLLDERLHYVIDDDSLAPLSKLHTENGVYLAFGNHDYLHQPETWKRMVEAHNINVLRDQSVIIDKHLKITGLNDYRHSKNSSALSDLAVDNAKYYSILLDHQPRRMEQAMANAYDLYLSGHTHTGQLFPNHLITEAMYKLDYGRYDCDDFTAITSSGYGFWGAPVRTEAAPEIVVLEISGK